MASAKQAGEVYKRCRHAGATRHSQRPTSPSAAFIVGGILQEQRVVRREAINHFEASAYDTPTLTKSRSDALSTPNLRSSAA
jgi:hypothetical protein